jgi:DNA mismatch endonuclease (patch repair protein)
MIAPRLPSQHWRQRRQHQRVVSSKVREPLVQTFALTCQGSICHDSLVSDVFTKEKRSQVMGAIRSQGNKDTELKLASILRAARITGWRRHQPLPGRPDFVFRRDRLALFVDGCFWHGCPKHGRQPGTNITYWAQKLIRNKARDRSVSKTLRRTGWMVIRIWEHQLSAPFAIAAKISRALAKNRSSHFSAGRIMNQGTK